MRLKFELAVIWLMWFLCIFCCSQHFYSALIIDAFAIFKDLGRVFMH